MSSKSVPPSIKETAFDCPHCGAYTTQQWYGLYAQGLPNDHRIPSIVSEEFLEKIRQANAPADAKETALKRFQRSRSGLVTLSEGTDNHYSHSAENLHLSQCFNCRELSVWIHDRLVLNSKRSGASIRCNFLRSKRTSVRHNPSSRSLKASKS